MKMANIFQEILAKNLKTIRKNRNLTQFDLAELCNTSTNYIALIETCKKFPSSNMLSKITEILNIQPQELFNSQNNKEKNLTISKGDIIKDISNVLNKYL